jgi:hypothetical protein
MLAIMPAQSKALVIPVERQLKNESMISSPKISL